MPVLLVWYNTAWVVSIMQWDDKFDSMFFTPEEIAESDAVAEAITKEIQSGHGGMLPMERSSVDK